jgi:uncharacterized protein (DUF924 family)
MNIARYRHLAALALLGIVLFAPQTAPVLADQIATTVQKAPDGAPEAADVRAYWLGRTAPEAMKVLRFWYEEWDQDRERGGRGRYNDKWFPHGEEGAAGSAKVDQEIRDRFLTLFETAVSNKLGWRVNENPYENLAFIILIDQFSRNMFRGQDKAYTHDELALNAARVNVEKEFHRYYFTGYQRLFVVYPFMHDEKLESQRLSIALLKAINEHPEHPFEFLNAFAKGMEHYQVVFMFGRYPHRNIRRDRPDTALEKAYLAKKGTRGFVDGSKW